jgi:hypothetical protein
MSIAMPPAHAVGPSFEVVAFQARPADGGVAVLELRGRFAGAAPRRFDRARLRVERPAEVLELAALRDSGDATEAWSATFAVAVDVLQDASFALAVGRGLLLDLPAPDIQTPDGSPAADYVRLAREANQNRRQLLELQVALDAERESRALIQRHADELTAQRDDAVQAHDVAREELRCGLDELDAERTRVGEEASAELAAAHAAHEQALAEAHAQHEDARAAAADVHAQELQAQRAETAAAGANADDARAQAQEARAELATARAELTDLRSQLEAARFELDIAVPPHAAAATMAMSAADPLVTTAVIPAPGPWAATPGAEDGEVEFAPEDEPEELRTLEAPSGAIRMPQLQQLQIPARPRELLTVAMAPDNRPRTIAMSVLALAFFAFAAALGVGPL